MTTHDHQGERNSEACGCKSRKLAKIEGIEFCIAILSTVAKLHDGADKQRIHADTDLLYAHLLAYRERLSQ